jgi:formylglycine-generating enzyme required for sulfatase activity
MHGNVWEWVEDNWHDDYKGAPGGGSVWSGGDATFRVLRGGSWYKVALDLRSASRFRDVPDLRSIDVGFRVARSL